MSVRERGVAAVLGTECGNGVVLDHGDGWETQYCHLAQGTLNLQPGAVMAQGSVLGKVGLSGLTEYPHLHFVVRYRGAAIDPSGFGATATSCGTGRPLWNDAVARELKYESGRVLNRGFAGAGVTTRQIDAEEISAPNAEAQALVAFVRAIGLRAEDRQRLTVTGPSGATFSELHAKPLESDKAEYVMFSGRKRPVSGFERGQYRARYVVERAGKIIISEEFVLSI